MAARGPTYERVQRLLEERRARASAQLAAQTQESCPEGHAGQLGRGRLQQVSPDSDRSFEFDRPPFISDAGALVAAQEILRNSSYTQEDDAAWHGASASGALPQQHNYAGWEDQPPSRAQFQPPPGDFDDDYHQEQAAPGATASRHGASRLGLHGSYEATARMSTPPPVASVSSQREEGDGSPTLAELEAMLNQTMLQLNLSTQPLPQPQQPRQLARDQPPLEAGTGRGLQGVPPPQPPQQGDIRVPSNKDMAYGMGGGGDGPFDISDIWAMESQPSASQRSASHSDHAAYRSEDGQEVNSYAAAYGYQRHHQQQQQHPSAEEALYGGAVATQRMGSDPAHYSSESTTPGSHQTAGPQSGQGYARQGAAPQQQRHQQQQQPAPRPRATSPGPVGSRPGAGAPPGRAAGAQQTTRPQRPVSAQMGARPAGATMRRSVSPGASPRPRSALENVPARYNQPPAWQQQYQQQQQPQRPRSPDVYPAFSFQPRINPRSREIAERLLPSDKERRLEQLSKPRNERFEQRAEQLRQAKLEEELRECSFQPRTGRAPSTPRVRGPTPVHERLYNTKPAWEQKRDDILRAREKEVLASCTFQPQCGSRQSPDRGRRSSSVQRQRPASVTRGRPGAGSGGAGGSGGGGGGAGTYVPIHQRVADLLRSRNEKLAKAQMKMELDSGPATFQPEINRRSVVLAAERQRQQPAEVAALPASERLYRLAQEQRAMSASRRGREYDLGSSYGDGGDLAGSRDQRAAAQQQPGVPAINPRSRALAESSDLPQDFLARQAYLAALGHEKRALYRSLLEESTCTFQPQLISRGGSLASSGVFGPGPGSVAGDGESRAGREGGGRLSKLAYEDVQKSAALRDALAQHHYSQFTFTPRINETSRRIGRRHSLTDLYRDEERQAKLERLAAQMEAARAAECTFKPAINPRSASLGRQRRGSLVLASADVAEQAHKLRSSILMEARALKEYEELKECTFTPAINRQGPPRTAGPVAVPGLGRHMELKEMARRKKEAEEARKAEVWNQRPKSPGPRVGVTVPQPFSFEQRVLPWQRPRSAVLAEQQHMEAHQKRALATLKSQRQQQRREAEERRSAHLQRIMQEAVGAGGGQYLQHPEQQQRQQGGQGQAYGEYDGGPATYGQYGGEVPEEEVYAY
ncbi:hypothetical protein HYH02_013527 [Chlamydomonas schloesseri]|uniref:Uncharacterized protein n=1 Tax=Chlamydomonas schloesseri TaxID=2026947 RepID=A0A835SSE8_9CHLO|nr:hypothetical protein HYH02_013527 [Chlamydomonas schloesseri]|eukprot:KAG2430996.1 hypothetical protein HYH02_013527 [Chlamydomonas schloesseri]